MSGKRILGSIVFGGGMFLMGSKLFDTIHQEQIAVSASKGKKMQTECAGHQEQATDSQSTFECSCASLDEKEFNYYRNGKLLDDKIYTITEITDDVCRWPFASGYQMKNFMIKEGDVSCYADLATKTGEVLTDDWDEYFQIHYIGDTDKLEIRFKCDPEDSWREI